MKKLIFFLVLSAFFSVNAKEKVARKMANDDAHNHDGSHPDSPTNCGTNYMLGDEVARLGSHSFAILGADGPNHIIASHRSGTPPHNYQFLFRVRLDKPEMDDYLEILKNSKTLPAFTTIYFDKNGNQLDRTFFCLSDLPKIFGDGKKKGDSFEKLFPIRASLQKNPDHEGSFPIGKSVAPGKFITLEREDVELIVYRYMPSYLPQDTLRALIKNQEKQIVPLLSHSPLSQNEAVETASKRSSYMKTDGSLSSGNECPKNYYLPKTKVLETIHTFLLVAEVDENTLLASHYYEMAPQNFQTAIQIKVSAEEMALYRKAKEGTSVPPLLQTRVISADPAVAKNYYFCMEDIRTLTKNGKLKFTGTIYKDSSLNDYKLGMPVGTIEVESADVKVLLNRRLESLMNPLEVAKDVLGH